ncbi:unnamed protein product [Linum tenue]|uniref:Pentatricopeptide repeat-containing protein n=1 Tax=Linum tenue TaxID=586396 RepID=A0AAV0ILA2_9ROSI|nr:unnamed protein product [Linum tenue]
MDMAASPLSLKPFVSSHSICFSPTKLQGYPPNGVKIHKRLEVVAKGMLPPRKFMQKRRKVEVFKDSADEADQKNWRKLMKQIEDTGSAVSVLRSERIQNQEIPRDLVLGTVMRFKQLRKWNLVIEILEWLRSQLWWDFGERDFILLIIAYGKQGDCNRAEKVLSFMTEEVFQSLLDAEKPPLKPDQKMFHMMIYMYKKSGNYEQARKLFGIMAERGIPQSTITYNSLMSFETNYKEVSKIYDQMQRSGHQPDVVSYALLINAYGKARREDEALAVFEDMMDAGVRPTHKAYNILLDAFAISGMVEQARTVFKSMRRDRITPDLCSYTTMLSAYVNASDMDGAEKFFKRIKYDGLKPNVVTYGTLIKGYAKVNDLDKMMERFEEMQSDGGIRPNQTIFTTVMDAHGKNKDFASAVSWYKEMESRGLRPDQKAKNILLSLCKTEDDQKEAAAVTGIAESAVTSQAINGSPRFADDSDDEDDDDDEYDEDGEDDYDDFDGEPNLGDEQEGLILSGKDVGLNVDGLHNLTVLDL